MAGYRPNVAAIIRRKDGKILICERVDFPGSWQFPQGGRKERETPEQALERELQEEISLRARDFRILERKGPYRYEYPGPARKRSFVGQEQIYFLVELLGAESSVRVETEVQEFRSHRWISPDEFRLAWLPPMKWEVYRQVFLDFFHVDIAV
jgi:putative (di)nucleoside polyphosphate hydrolase